MKTTKQGVRDLNGKPETVPIGVTSSRGPSRGPQPNLQISYGRIHSGKAERIRYVEGAQFEAGNRTGAIGFMQNGASGILVFVQDLEARDNNPGRTITINPDDFSKLVDTLVKMRAALVDDRS